MLFFIIIWLFLSLYALIVGNALLVFLKVNRLNVRLGDYVFICLFVGVSVLSVGFLSLSIFLPLTFTNSLVLSTILCSLSLLSYSGKVQLWFIFNQLYFKFKRNFYGIFLIVIGSALYSAQVLAEGDTCLYHFQLLKWFNEYGAVKGLALVNDRLGFVSSWFAFAAPFESLLPSRTVSLTNGYLLFITLMLLSLSLFRALKGMATMSDCFILVALSSTVTVMYKWTYPITLSPNFPIAILIVISCWSILLVDDTSKNTNASIRVLLFIPLILSLFAVTVKLTAIPLLLVILTIMLGMMIKELSFSKIFYVCLVVCLYVFPLIIVNVITTGCLFYPVPYVCMDLPWAVGSREAQIAAQSIVDWARWHVSYPPEGANANDWIFPWIRSAGGMLSSLLIITSIVCSFFIIIRGRNSAYMVTAIGLAGTVFILFTAPNLVFGIGFFIVVPSFFVGCIMNNHKCRLSTYGLISDVSIYVIVGITLFSINVFQLTFTESSSYQVNRYLNNKFVASTDAHINLVLPPKLARLKVDHRNKSTKTSYEPIEFKTAYVGNMAYIYPVNTANCVDADLPCSTGPLINIRLMNESKGLSGGFAKKTSH